MKDKSFKPGFAANAPLTAQFLPERQKVGEADTTTIPNKEKEWS